MVTREPELKLTRPAERRAQDAIVEVMLVELQMLAVARTRIRLAKPETRLEEVNFGGGDELHVKRFVIDGQVGSGTR